MMVYYSGYGARHAAQGTEASLVGLRITHHIHFLIPRSSETLIFFSASFKYTTVFWPYTAATNHVQICSVVQNYFRSCV